MAPGRADPGAAAAVAEAEDGGEAGRSPAGDEEPAELREAGGSEGPDRSYGLPVDETEEDLERGTDSELHGKIRAFHKQREEERLRMFHVVVRLCFKLFFVGVPLVSIGQGLGFVFPSTHPPAALIILGYILCMLGIVIGSCCPYELFDFDDVCRRKPKFMAVFFFLSGMVNALQLRYYPHLDAVKLLLIAMMLIRIFIIVICSVHRPRWMPEVTSLMAWYLGADGLSWGGIFLFNERNDWLAIPEIPSYAISFVNMFYFVSMFVGWFWHRWRYAGREHGNSVRLYMVFYYWTIIGGLRWASYGATWLVYPRESSADAVAASLELIRGLSTMLPSVAVLALGRDRFFQTLGGYFDRDGARLRRDGAFVAALLETVAVQEGQAYWIHRERPDESHPPFDPRRCWQKGFVTEMADQTDFAVRIHDSLLDATTVRVKLPSAGKGESMEHLLMRAQRDLRCVEFENLSPELMHRVGQALHRPAADHRRFEGAARQRHGLYEALGPLWGHLPLAPLVHLGALHPLCLRGGEQFVFLGSREEGLRMLDGMTSFHVSRAHCYDPNEEARLLQVIDAVGTARFNTRISNMASMTKARMEKSSKRRSGSSRRMQVSRYITRRTFSTRSMVSSQSSVRSTPSEAASAYTTTTQSSAVEVEEGLAL